MINRCSEDHFCWIGIMADRIICSKNREKELPLLSLSFLEDNIILDFFSKFSRPIFPITVDSLLDAKLYGIIVSAIASHNKISFYDIEHFFDFDSILNILLNEGYIPQNPCETSGLKNGIIEQHINLCKSIEFFVVDKSINTTLLLSDLYYLPRSFYFINLDDRIIHLEDAISLWLSKFHCNMYFSDEIQIHDYETSKNELIQIDTAKFSKIAAVLARIFPEKIDKDEIQNGDNDEEIQSNINLCKIVFDVIHSFVVEKFPTDENLFYLFISDLYWATRSGVKKFVMIDHPIYEPRLPAGNRCLRSPRIKRKFGNNKGNASSCLDLLNAVLSSQHKKENKRKIVRPKIESKSSKHSYCEKNNPPDDDIIIIDSRNGSCFSNQVRTPLDDQIVDIDSRNSSTSDVDYINKQRSYECSRDANKYYNGDDIQIGDDLYSSSNDINQCNASIIADSKEGDVSNENKNHTSYVSDKLNHGPDLSFNDGNEGIEINNNTSNDNDNEGDKLNGFDFRFGDGNQKSDTIRLNNSFSEGKNNVGSQSSNADGHRSHLSKYESCFSSKFNYNFDEYDSIFNNESGNDDSKKNIA
ncbi:hypothetical protein M9Y10_014744 [Tritrichomonas musculus]|uniref:Uncharacterized protein n=1 Tax=Tritrichomonas musculus TaxID=1915356 RepID=A0ABR2L152_9EUKA